ncbi:MAG TPA: FtsX-like permease family protein, partial [Acidobacteriota bacterium]|nr:FtsX-like permease family protein [Acidobacteriota bacterium]
RNIFRQKRRTVFTGLSIVGGFTLAVIFIGWADGSYNNIIDQFTRTRLGHIQIHEKTYLDRPTLYKTVSNVPNVGAVLDRTKGVESWTPRVFSAGLAGVRDKSAGVQIIGIDPPREARTTRFDQKIVEGRDFLSSNAHEAVLGRGLANILQARLGDDVVLLSQGADGSIAEDQYTLVGVASSGDELTDRTAYYLPLATAQDYLVLEGKVHEIAVVVSNLSRVEAVSKAITLGLGDATLSVSPWQVFARAFYNAMKADKAGMWVMLLVIVVIVAVGVLNTVLMSVLERRREYGLLKALGTKPRRIVRLVLLEVVILAVFSMLIGAGLGLGANMILSRHGIKFSSGLTYGGMVFDTMKSEINLRSFTIPALTVIVSAVLISLFPAVKASRAEPARTMRMH